MQSLLGEDTGLQFRHGVTWCHRPGETPHPHPLAQRLSVNFQYLEIDGFDVLFGDLNRELAGVQRFASVDAPKPARQFDDEPVLEAMWADVDADLALTTLRQYLHEAQSGTDRLRSVEAAHARVGV